MSGFPNEWTNISICLQDMGKMFSFCNKPDGDEIDNAAYNDWLTDIFPWVYQAYSL